MAQMSDAEVYTYIVKQWVLEATVDRIMVSLVCLGRPMTKAAILTAILLYCDSQTENKTYKAKA